MVLCPLVCKTITAFKLDRPLNNLQARKKNGTFTDPIGTLAVCMAGMSGNLPNKDLNVLAEILKL